MVTTCQEQFCPICLNEPTSGRVTKCGHVFCYPCILHYLSLGDRNWRRCPICYDSVYARDLKPVKINHVSEYTEGKKIKMVLMQKFKV